MSYVVLYLHLFAVLCIAHPAIAIPIGTGLISLFYNKLDSYPRGHALLSIFVRAGFDLPGICEAFRRLWTGAPPTGGLTILGKMKGDPTTKVKVPSIPAGTSAMRMGILAACVAVCAACLLGCPMAATDVQAADDLAQCVIKDIAQKDTFEEVVNDCAGATLKFVEDMVATILLAEQKSSDGGQSLLTDHLKAMHHK